MLGKTASYVPHFHQSRAEVTSHEGNSAAGEHFAMTVKHDLLAADTVGEPARLS